MSRQKIHSNSTFHPLFLDSSVHTVPYPDTLTLCWKELKLPTIGSVCIHVRSQHNSVYWIKIKG